MDFEELVAFMADPADVPDSVTRKAYGKIYQWTDNKNGDSAESILQSERIISRFLHEEPLSQFALNHFDCISDGPDFVGIVVIDQ